MSLHDVVPKSTVPEGECGPWTVESFTIDQKGASFHNLRESINGRRRRVKPGKHTALKCNGSIWMSDTDAELWERYDIVRQARGDCLVTGLGLGLDAVAMLLSPAVQSVTVVEKSLDVCHLVWQHLMKQAGLHRDGSTWVKTESSAQTGRSRVVKRAILVHADALEWSPPRGSKFHTVWHDIWPTICTDHWPEMKKLTRKYAPRLHKGGVQDCWAKEQMRP